MLAGTARPLVARRSGPIPRYPWTWRSLAPPWALAVFALALVVRLGFYLIVDQPLLSSHQLTHFSHGLLIAEHPHPVLFILTSDEWHTWAEHWTIAPLYYVFEAFILLIFGPHLRPLVMVQCLLGAFSAVAVAAIGRELVGKSGLFAGVVYSFYAQSVELPSWTLTENLHNVLFLWAFFVLLKGLREEEGWNWTVGGGVLLGLSALARSVSSAFIPIAGLWHAWSSGRADRVARALVLVTSGIVTILPWTLRNVALGEFVPIETAAYGKIWTANNFVRPERLVLQQQYIASRATSAEKREAALRFGWNGIRRHPRQFFHKVNVNFWHYFRPEGLHYLLRVQSSIEPWRHLFTILFEDGIVVGLIPPFLVFAFAGRRSPAWLLILLWCSYLLFFEVVVLLTEAAGHRSVFVPIALAGAIEGARILSDRDERKRVPTLIALGVAAVWVGFLLGPFAGPALRDIRASLVLQPAIAALDRGDPDRAERLAESAATIDPLSARVWNDYGRALALRGKAREAAEAYQHGADRSLPENLRARVALPRLLAEAGRSAEAASAVSEANRASWWFDPWLTLEIAWRELPAPVADEIDLGEGDYGAVRGFLHPRGRGVPSGLQWTDREAREGVVLPGPHRWTLHRAWLRLRPTTPSPAYNLTLVMGSPYPSPNSHPEVLVRVNGAEAGRFRLDPELKSFTTRVLGAPELLVQLDSPTWNKVGEPAEQGVRVDRLAVAPAGS